MSVSRDTPVDPRTGLRFLSACSGIGSDAVTWHPLGRRCAAFPGIDAHACSVLAYRDPDFPTGADFTAIQGDEHGNTGLLADDRDRNRCRHIDRPEIVCPGGHRRRGNLRLPVLSCGGQVGSGGDDLDGCGCDGSNGCAGVDCQPLVRGGKTFGSPDMFRNVVERWRLDALEPGRLGLFRCEAGRVRRRHPGATRGRQVLKHQGNWESGALCAETVINDSGIGRRLGNLEDLRIADLAANRRTPSVTTCCSATKSCMSCTGPRLSSSAGYQHHALAVSPFMPSWPAYRGHR